MSAPVHQLTPEERKALEKALEGLRLGVPGVSVPIEQEAPEKLIQRLGVMEDLERRLGRRPTVTGEMRGEIEQTTAGIRKQTDVARQEGLQRGQQLFGDLGRASPAPQIAGLDLSGSPLAQATEMAKRMATEGLSSQEEQVLRERSQQQISSRVQDALRQQRSLSSDMGMRGETRQAREADILKAAIRQERDSAAGLQAADIALRREGLGLFGLLGGKMAETQQQQNQLKFQLGQLSSQIEQFNIGVGGTERQRQLMTELANVGLQQATESMGIQRVLQSVGLEQAAKSQERAFALQQQEINRPIQGPSGGGGGGSPCVCTALWELGLMPDEIYNAEGWVMARFVDEEITVGYHWFGMPLARAIRGSRLLQWIFLPLALAWAHELNRQAGIASSSPFLGKLIFYVGRPICKLLGKIKGFFS